MPSGNPKNLKPFKKGHKKLGGRKAGVPNKFPRAVKEAILEAAGQIGLDGKGYGGLTGFLIRLAITEPESFGALLGRLLPKPGAAAPVRHTIDLTKLDDDELLAMERIVAKAQVPLPPDDDASLQPFDGDPHFQKKIDELLASERLKKKKKKASDAGRG